MARGGRGCVWILLIGLVFALVALFGPGSDWIPPWFEHRAYAPNQARFVNWPGWTVTDIYISPLGGRDHDVGQGPPQETFTGDVRVVVTEWGKKKSLRFSALTITDDPQTNTKRVEGKS